MGCLLCGSAELHDLASDGVLQGATVRTDRLYSFRLLQCAQCGHIQKAVDDAWQAVMETLYSEDYGVAKKAGRQIDFVDGKIVNRATAAVGKLDEMLSLGDSGALLDLGCGAGSFLAAFASQKPNWKVAGFDVGDIHAEEILSIPGAGFYSKSLKQVDQTFDLITLSHVVEHLTDPIGVLKEAVALLRPGGYVVIRVPCFLGTYSDFFILEHCSHFVPETLAFTLSSAGLEIKHELSGLSAIEIGYVAQKGAGKASDIRDPAAIHREALRCLKWAASLPNFIHDNIRGRKFGLFGVGGAGVWLGTYLRGQMSFFVDEDKGKQGSEFAGCPIISPQEVSKGDLVFVTFNTPEASARVAARLQQQNPSCTFLVPPALA